MTTILLLVLALALVAAVGVVVWRARRPSPPSIDASTATPLPAPPDEVAPVEPPPEPTAQGPPEALAEVDLVEPTPSAQSLRGAATKSRGLFAALRSLRGRGKVDAATYDELEETLLRADVGVSTTQAILADLRARVGAGELASTDDLVDALREDLIARLELVSGAAPEDLVVDPDPEVVSVWLMVGVNGVGKTTTLGKLAAREAARGNPVLLAAGDTFRAAAAEQLTQWAERSGVELVRGEAGGDPSAVVFDAVQRAKARGNGVVLADTAGRLHTKVNLVEELKKIRRVADRPPGKVTEVLLVIDATTGQNALAQARQFTEAVAVTGVVLTKLDGTARGGVVVAIQHELGLPVRFVGTGEGPADLQPFVARDFVDALFEDDLAEG